MSNFLSNQFGIYQIIDNMDLSYKLYVCVQTVQSTQGLAKAHESETNTFSDLSQGQDWEWNSIKNCKDFNATRPVKVDQDLNFYDHKDLVVTTETLWDFINQWLSRSRLWDICKDRSKVIETKTVLRVLLIHDLTVIDAVWTELQVSFDEPERAWGVTLD